MEIRAGYDIAFQCFQDTPMTLMLSIEPDRVKDLISEHSIEFSPNVASRDYVDMFGNTCTRIIAPPGLIEIRNDFLISDSGLPDEVAPDARQLEVGDLPDDVLVYLLGSRYCDTQKLSDLAWSLFGRHHAGLAARAGDLRLRASADFSFGYHHARCDRTASEGHAEQVGVCRDFAHLAVTLCRCMNIPARYCTGYLGDIGVPDRSGADGFFRLVRGLSRRPLVHLRCPSQPSPDRPDRDGARTRCRRRRDFHRVRHRATGAIYRDYRGSGRAEAGVARGLIANPLTASPGWITARRFCSSHGLDTAAALR